MMRPERHHWVHLAGLGGLISAHPPPVLARWVEERRPLVVASAGAEDSPGRVRLGLALPDKTRIGCLADGAAITALQPPPTIAETVDHAPESWRARLAALDAALPGRCRIYGSLAWQIRTGLAYVRPDSSDLDLIVTVADGADADGVCAVLGRFEGEFPRLDGELDFGPRGAVPWREWAGGAARFLVKRHGAPLLAERTEWEGAA